MSARSLPGSGPVIFSLTYCSRSLFAEEEMLDALGGILSGARAYNAGHGITGALLFDGARFAQVLEGERGIIEALMRRIASDPRQAEVDILVREFQSARRFDGWSMAYLGMDGGAERLLDDHPGRDEQSGARLAAGMAAAAG